MLGLQTDFRPPRASIQTPAAFLAGRSPAKKERSGIYRARLRALASELWAWLEPANYRSLVLYTRTRRHGVYNISSPYLPHAVYCPIDFADRRTLYHCPARESSHLLLYMLLLTSVRVRGRESVRQVGKY